MAAHKHINKICCVVTAVCVLLAGLCLGSGALGLQTASAAPGYGERLFDTSRVHTIDIVIDDWEGFLSTCENEEYALCSVVIDNEARKNIGIRAKGNTSLTQVAQYGNDRYSFKLEFDHYDSAQSYYGLDKLSLNNLIQDNTCMKDYLVYQMMGAFGVPAPLCSYAYITVNGEDWGLYLAVEAVEDAFLLRNFGRDYGELYKPDSTDMGGGRGNGGFDMEGWQEAQEPAQEAGMEARQMTAQSEAGPEGFGRGFQGGTLPDGADPGEGGFPGGALPDEGEPPSGGALPDGQALTEDARGAGKMQGDMAGRGGPGGMAADDVSLIYTDDDFDSYQNIFDNAKTDVTDADKERLIEALKRLNAQEGLESTLYIEDVLRYFVVHNFVCNFDSYTGSMIHNYYLYEKDGQLAMIPWDYNLAFGGFMGAQDAQSLVNYPIDTPVSGGTTDSRPMLSWIFADEAYTRQYHVLFSEFVTQFFENGACAQLIQNAQALIAPYVEKDPTKFCTYEEFEAGAAALQTFCSLRGESVAGQLAGTVPSTQEAQSRQPEALIAADGLDLNDMGSMHSGGMGGGMGGPMGEAAPRQTEDDTEARSQPAAPQEDGSQTADSAQQPPDQAGLRPAEERSQADRQTAGQPGEASPAGNWAMLGASAAVLLLGLGIAFGYRKKV